MCEDNDYREEWHEDPIIFGLIVIALYIIGGIYLVVKG